MKKYQPWEMTLYVYGEDIIRTSGGDFSGGETDFSDGNTSGSGGVNMPSIDF